MIFASWPQFHGLRAESPAQVRHVQHLSGNRCDILLECNGRANIWVHRTCWCLCEQSACDEFQSCTSSSLGFGDSGTYVRHCYAKHTTVQIPSTCHFVLGFSSLKITNCLGCKAVKHNLHFLSVCLVNVDKALLEWVG